MLQQRRIFNEGIAVLKNIRNMSFAQKDIILQEIEDKGVIILNRPQKLNALTIPMVKDIYTTLKEWEAQKTLVIIKGAGEKAFCSGGNLEHVINIQTTEDANRKGKEGLELLYRQYILNDLIGSYKIPYIAFINGIVMGGGAGLSVHGRYQVATERTVFSMPEAQIGLFPDCGASYFLPRLNGCIGLYLALTGHRLKGSDVVKAGLATHYCQREYLDSLEKQLFNCCNEKDIEDALTKFHTNDNTEFTLTPVLEKINNCFSAKTMEEIISRLTVDGSSWAQDTLKIILKSCPISLKVALKELEFGKQLNLQECLQMEKRLAFKFSDPGILRNLSEGIRATMIDKDNNPKWNPQTLSEIPEKDVLDFFQTCNSTDGL